ncbi:MAG: hypothetical protein ACR2PX_28155 [Endozoicomonas sp.]
MNSWTEMRSECLFGEVYEFRKTDRLEKSARHSAAIFISRGTGKV